MFWFSGLRGEVKLLDDVIGYRWAVLEWGGNPENLFTPEQRDILRRLGAALVSVRPTVQCGLDRPKDPDGIVVGDVTGKLKEWFDSRPTPVVFIRPDRFVAAACISQEAGRALESLAQAVALRADAPVATTPAKLSAASGATRSAASASSSSRPSVQKVQA